MKALAKIAEVLVVIGALNWGLKALSDSAELVQYLGNATLIRVVYGLVGISGLYALYKLFK